jgi:hypothetical protein
MLKVLMIALLLIVWQITVKDLHCQELKATRFELSGQPFDGLQGAVIGTREVIPLVIAHTGPIPQPVRILVGPGGSTRALEISGFGEALFRGPMAIGPTTGTDPSTTLRLADVVDGGRGIGIDLRNRPSYGLHISNIGASASEFAGILVSSAQNGVGTGIRVGGPAGTTPTLSTGVEIWGGTGIRYNALTSGSGTALDIGGTQPPNKGITINVSGGDQVGLSARANTLGTAVAAASISSSYSGPPTFPGTAIVAMSATNSNATADSAIGVRALVRRAGVGSRNITSVGVLADVAATGSLHSGTAIGMMGRASNTSPGTAVAIGGAFSALPGHLALVALDGDVHLGSRNGSPLPTLDASTLSGSRESTTYAHHFATSGAVRLASRVAAWVVKGAVNAVDADDAGAEVHGVLQPADGRVVVLTFDADGTTVVHQAGQVDPQYRIILHGEANLVVPLYGAITLWYDGEEERWRLIATSW